MTRPITDEQIAVWDLLLKEQIEDGNPWLDGWSVDNMLALRARLDQEIERRKSAEKVVEAAGNVLYPAKLAWSEDAQRLHDAITAHREKWPKEEEK